MLGGERLWSMGASILMSLLRLTVGSSTTKRKCLATETVRCHPNEMHNLKAVPGFFWGVQSAKESATVPDMEICWSNVLSLAQSTDSLSISGLGMEFTRLGSALASAYSRLVLKGWTSETPRTLFDMGIHGIPCYYSWTLRTSDCWQASMLLKCICHSHVGSCWVDFSCRPAIDLHEVWQVKVPWMD